VPHIGLQLWTLRAHLHDLDRLLDQVAPAGVTAIEPFGLGDPRLTGAERVVRARALRRSAVRAGMAVPSAHVALPEPSAARTLVAELHALGASTAIAATPSSVAGFGPDALADVDSIARFADRLNALSDVAAREGIRIGYHNHAHDWADVDGRPAFDHLVDRLSPDVDLELDVLWAQLAGQDPAALVGRLGDRVRHLHVGDTLAGNRDVQLPAGQGDIALTSSIAACGRSVEALYIEATTPPPGTSIVELVTASAAWLRLAVALLVPPGDETPDLPPGTFPVPGYIGHLHEESA